MFTISVCIIVRDEELTFERILKCANQFADEIIVVDTGSIDNSINIAKLYTDRVYDFKWCDDFSKARNFSISKATKDYFMWLDADDYIDNDSINKIINLKNSNDTADVYMMKYVIGDPPVFEFYRERLLRNNGKYLFNGAVHEAIIPHGDIRYLDIKIEHRKEKVNNPTRNADIYEGLISKGVKLTPRDNYYYGRELYYLGKYSESNNVLSKYLELDNLYTPDKIGAHLIMSDNYYYLQEYKSGVSVLLKCITSSTPTPEICCKLAKNFEALDNTTSAIFWYKSALNAEKSSGFNNLEYEQIIPYIELCRLLYSINRDESAMYHRLARELNPNHPAVKYNEQFFKEEN